MPCQRIAEDADIVRVYPGLVDAVALIGGPAINGRATMGGNLCNAADSLKRRRGKVNLLPEGASR